MLIPSEVLESVVVVCFSATVVISGGLEFAFISFLSLLYLFKDFYLNYIEVPSSSPEGDRHFYRISLFLYIITTLNDNCLSKLFVTIYNFNTFR